MKSQTSVTVEVTLQLTQEEAEWLHGSMQNPLHGQALTAESALDRDMRLRFWAATKPAPKLPGD